MFIRLWQVSTQRVRNIITVPLNNTEMIISAIPSTMVLVLNIP